MQPPTPYRPGKYPPGPTYPAFDGNNKALNAAEEARMLLIQKRINHTHYHVDRLQHDGFLPRHPPPMVDEYHDTLDERGTQTDPMDTKPKATQTEAYTSTGTGPDDDGGGPQRERQPGRGVIERVTAGATSTLGGMAGGLAEGGTNLLLHATRIALNAGAGVLKGIGRYVGDMPEAPEWPSHVPSIPSALALGDDHPPPQPKAKAKPRKVEDDEEARPRKVYEDDEAQPMELTGGSSGSNEPPARQPVFPYPFVNVTPYNGDVFTIHSDEEEEPAAAVQRRARRAAPDLPGGPGGRSSRSGRSRTGLRKGHAQQRPRSIVNGLLPPSWRDRWGVPAVRSHRLARRARPRTEATGAHGGTWRDEDAVAAATHP